MHIRWIGRLMKGEVRVLMNIGQILVEDQSINISHLSALKQQTLIFASSSPDLTFAHAFDCSFWELASLASQARRKTHSERVDYYSRRQASEREWA